VVSRQNAITYHMQLCSGDKTASYLDGYVSVHQWNVVELQEPEEVSVTARLYNILLHK